MNYRVIIPKPVQKQLNNLPKQQLTDIPRPSGVKKLKGYDDTYPIRIGDYRIIYKIQEQEMFIIILSSIHRKDAY
ncbi:MAG UNVERIFIED_CONTAM: type II toxin-antitoxin system RelE/ParE family toxin [Microcystis novacekii LVE1205-3]